MPWGFVGAGERGVSLGRLSGASLRGVSPGRLSGASLRGVSPGRKGERFFALTPLRPYAPAPQPPSRRRPGAPDGRLAGFQ